MPTNSETADRLSNGFDINGTPFDGTANIITNFWGHARLLTIGGKSIPVNGSTDITFDLDDIGVASSDHKHLLSDITDLNTLNMPPDEALAGTSNTYRLITASMLRNVINQSVVSKTEVASRLETPRKINNTLFDGTGDITTSIWGTTRNITIGSKTRAVNGGSDLSWSLTEIGAAAINHTHSVSDIVDSDFVLPQVMLSTTGPHTLEKNTHYLVTNISCEMLFPANPNVGDIVRITNCVDSGPIVRRNGSKIKGFSDDLLLDTGAADRTFIYTEQYGWV